MRIALLFISIFLLAKLPSSTQQEGEERWFHKSSFYHVYVRSFKDSNNDGNGDLRGIIEKLDFIGERHDAIVLSSIFHSQNYDPSYDVIDYFAVDPIYGTIDVLKELISEAHKRRLKIILDIILNHTSDQHEWFRRSIAGDQNYEDFYVYHDGTPSKNGGRPSVPNNWVSEYGGSAWEWNDDRQQYYLHKFSKNQPDLNFRSREVRNAIRQILEFWLDVGIDGFHIDAAYHLLEDLVFRSEPTSGLNVTEDDPLYTLKTFSQDDNETFELLDEWRRIIHANNSTLIVETSPNMEKFAEYHRVTDIAIHRLFMNNFDLEALTAEGFESTVNDLMKDFNGSSLKNIAFPLGNHKTSRFRSRFTDEAQSLAILALQQTLTMVKMPYYGEEIGMIDHKGISWDDTHDLQACSASPEDYNEFSRDPQRTPFQWDGTNYAGFSSVKPWMEVHPNYQSLNYKEQRDADFSFYHDYMKISHSISLYDGYHEPQRILLNSQVLLHLVVINEGSTLLMINLGKNESIVNLDKFFASDKYNFKPSPRNLRIRYASPLSKELKIAEIVDPTRDIILAPYEVLILSSSSNIFKLSFAILSMALFMNYFI